jgi:hypothetical protein
MDKEKVMRDLLQEASDTLSCVIETFYDDEDKDLTFVWKMIVKIEIIMKEI